MLLIDQMTPCNVKAVAFSDKPTDSYRPTLHFPSALQSVLESLRSFFLFFGPETLLFRLTLISFHQTTDTVSD